VKNSDRWALLESVSQTIHPVLKMLVMKYYRLEHFEQEAYRRFQEHFG